MSLIFFFPGICPGLHNLASVFLGQKQPIPLSHGKWTNLCVCSSFPLIFGHIREQKFCGDTPKHQCWAGNQFHTTLDPSKQEYSGWIAWSATSSAPVTHWEGLGQWGISGIMMFLWVFVAKNVDIINSCGY